jgi:sialate O-acetylesterase
MDPQAITGPDGPAIPKSPQSQRNTPWRPAGLFNGMIYPLAPYAIQGAVWYQGESNADRAAQYQILLPALISDWRKLWARGNFPFGIIQLANYMEADIDPPRKSEWAELREAQAKVALADSNNGLVTAVDIGDARNIHPANKQEVGKRLALWALARVYKKRTREFSGPVFDKMTVDSGKVTLSFTHADSGFTVRGKTIKGFAMAGADSVFVWARADIKGKKVIVWSGAIKDPIAVRYGWANNPECNLYNKEGLPVFPFRTDTWIDHAP